MFVSFCFVLFRFVTDCGIRTMLASSINWKSLLKIGITYFLKQLQSSIFFVGQFLTTNLIASIDIGLFRLPISS